MHAEPVNRLFHQLLFHGVIVKGYLAVQVQLKCEFVEQFAKQHLPNPRFQGRIVVIEESQYIHAPTISRSTFETMSPLFTQNLAARFSRKSVRSVARTRRVVPTLESREKHEVWATTWHAAHRRFSPIFRQSLNNTCEMSSDFKNLETFRRYLFANIALGVNRCGRAWTGRWKPDVFGRMDLKANLVGYIGGLSHSRVAVSAAMKA